MRYKASEAGAKATGPGVLHSHAEHLPDAANGVQRQPQPSVKKTAHRVVLRSAPDGKTMVAFDMPQKGSFHRRAFRDHERALAHARLMRLEFGGVIADETEKRR